jgi:uncharacterized membrane protein
MSLAAIALFGITITADMLAAYHVIRIPDWFTMGGIDDARAILSAMLGCVSTVLALIFSVALLVLSMVANLFGPRLLYRFVQDWVTQVCIGLFMGAFIYVFLVFLVTHKDEHTSFIPQVSLITSWFLVLAAFGFLVFYSHRVAALIQNPDAIGRIVDDLRRAAERTASSIIKEPRPQEMGSVKPQPTMEDGVSLPSRTSGYVQEIDHHALVKAAAAIGAQISIPFRPGQFLLVGETLALVSPASALDSLSPLLLRSITMGRHRVLFQDLEFGVAQIVEIAIRALSPAINDTFTGVASVDLLGEALTVLAESPLSGDWFDADGSLRLRVRPLILSRLVKQAFDQIRQAANDNPAVLIRILATLGRLAPKFERPDDRKALIDQAAAVWETANLSLFVKMDREDIEAAWQKAQRALTSSGVPSED